MTWWKNLLYGPEREIVEGRWLLRSRAMELEEAANIVQDLRRELMDGNSTLWRDLGCVERPEVPAIYLRTDDDLLELPPSLDDLSNRDRRGLWIESRIEIPFKVHLRAGERPSIEPSIDYGDAGWEHVCKFIERYGRPLVWWQRWPAFAPYAALLAAAGTGLALAIRAGGVLPIVLLVLALGLGAGSAHHLASLISRRVGTSAPGIVIHQVPRAELRAARENRKADRKQRILTTIVIGPIGAGVGLLVKAWIDRW